MQSKMQLKILAGHLEEAVRKLTFLERRQQRQQPSLGESYRENVLALQEGWCFFLYYLLEQLHSCFLSNSILGFLCLPCHCLICLFNCLYWRFLVPEEQQPEEEENAAAQQPEQQKMDWA